MVKGGKVLFWVILAAALGFCIGLAGRFGMKLRDAKTAVIRVGNARTEVDYDLLAALNYMADHLEQAGYRVLGTAYNGEMYPEKFNQAGVNVFVRGFLPLYDVRMNDKAQNWFYLHRAGDFYEEEMRGYGLYLFSQREIYDEVRTELPAKLFESGAVWHKRLKPQYENDVLYIYEDDSNNFAGLLKQNLKAETYGAVQFAEMTSEEREAAFARARVVVYTMMPDGEDADFDKYYVPFAVYDIMSYGRPLVTNRRAGLERDYAGKVWLYDDSMESFISALQAAFGIADGQREQLAAEAREKLLHMAAAR